MTGEGLGSKYPACTVCANSWRPRFAALFFEACACRNIRPAPVQRIQDVGMVLGVLFPWAITSKAKTKAPKPQAPSLGVRWLRRWSYLTRAQALRYSRSLSLRSDCTSIPGLGPPLWAEPETVFSSDSLGRWPIHLSPVLYHSRFYWSIGSPPFCLKISEVIHGFKSK